MKKKKREKKKEEGVGAALKDGDRFISLKMMSSGSSVQVENGSFRFKLRKWRNQSVEDADEDGAEVVAVAEVEETPLEREKKWFAEQVRRRLLRTRAALRVTGSTVLDDDNAVEEISWLASLEEVLDALGEAREMFMAMFSEEKWAMLKASQESIAQGKVRSLRMKRHASRVAETREDAIVDLTAAPEQSDDGIAEFIETSRSLAELVWGKEGRERSWSKAKREKAEQERRIGGRREGECC